MNPATPTPGALDTRVSDGVLLLSGEHDLDLADVHFIIKRCGHG
jgi:hypothetical protein